MIQKPDFSSTYAPRTDAADLLLAAFDGVPQPGTRELRLSEEERQQLNEQFPNLSFQVLEDSGEKTWYQVTIEKE